VADDLIEGIARKVCKGDYDLHSEAMRDEHRETARDIIAAFERAYGAPAPSGLETNRG
jgi:hypothetical protein